MSQIALLVDNSLQYFTEFNLHSPS